jgi:acetoin utilization deacetylase AcuC-like enzyme
MRVGYCEDCLAHDTGTRHPESPDRLKAIRRGLTRQYGVEFATAESATVDQVAAVHDRSYVEAVREFCADGGGEWDADTVAVSETFDAALLSAGYARWAVAAALDGADGQDTPFSVARPPGHLAVVDDAMGFCFFNNAAVAAQWALEERAVDRVAVVDWDVHHGNGTQELFYDRGDVFYASVHEAGLYPGTGDLVETGVDAGEGYTLNLPFPSGSGDPAYCAAFEDCIEPALSTYDPDLVVVSAGFDAHERDPISRMRVSTEGYAALAERLAGFSTTVDAALAFVLEGGYSLDSLSESVATLNETFEGREPAPDDGPVGDDASAVIDEARAALGLA